MAFPANFAKLAGSLGTTESFWALLTLTLLNTEDPSFACDIEIISISWVDNSLELLTLAGKKLSFLSVPLRINGISSESDLPGSFARSRALPSHPVVCENGLNPPPCIKF